MSCIKENFSALVGHTPLLNASSFSEKAGINGPCILTKLECMNPAGSSKDRAALEMIRDAEEKGLLKKGGTIIEPTSGNTGIGLAAVAAQKGYRAILTLPDTMSLERRSMLKAYGAELVLTEGALGMKGAIQKAEELNAQIEGSVILGQFDNPANSLAHYKSTGPEIYSDTDGRLDYFVASIGTGGTISGTARYLKEQNPSIRVIGVEPASSPLISKGICGPHKIQGIGANFIPSILDLSLIDEIIAVTDEDAYAMGKLFACSEGVLVGVSSGAALAASLQIAHRHAGEPIRIVTLLPDSGDRYLSCGMFE